MLEQLTDAQRGFSLPTKTNMWCGFVVFARDLYDSNANRVLSIAYFRTSLHSQHSSRTRGWRYCRRPSRRTAAVPAAESVHKPKAEAAVQQWELCWLRIVNQEVAAAAAGVDGWWVGVRTRPN
jgi:hypothetical protein